MHIRAVHKISDGVEVVAKGRLFARDTDVVHVELGAEGVSNDRVGKQLAELKGSNLHLDALLGAVV